MKRILFCAGVLALAASCTESELDTISVQEGSKKGITFQTVEEGGENASTRGGFLPGEGTYVPFWYAEVDKITVWGTKVTGTNGVNAAKDFDGDKKATYKATQSARLGVFTGASDDDVLGFDGSNEKTPSQFFALYPSSLTATYASKAFTVDLSGLALEDQTQNDLKGDGIYDNFIKWSATTAYPENSYDAVGEKINLNFQRPLAGMVFSTVNANQYTKGDASIFGNLKTITLTANGKKADGSDDASKDNLTFGLGSSNAALTVDLTDMENPKAALVAGDTPASEIALTMKDGNGLEWSDDARAFMVVAPVERTEIEYLTAKYEFKNITLTVDASTTNSMLAGGFQNFPALDISTYDYLVTNESSSGVSNDRALIINKGNLTSIFDGTNVTWNKAPIAATTFSDIICNVLLTDAELKSLAKFTSLEKITLAKNTSIPADAFKDLALTSIDMPLVTKIDDKAFAKLTTLDSLKLKSYQFESETVNNLFFNTKTTLKTLDISGVVSMEPTYGILRDLNFKGFTALETVTLKDGAVLSANAFNGCTALETVNGTVQLAVNAFQDCALLETINVVGTVIPENAFNGCDELKSVLVNKAQIVPTEVGASAFVDTKIEYMDLSQITKLGKQAFKSSDLKATSKTVVDVTVGASSIPASAFEGTAITMINFTNATSFEADILKDCAGLKQVKFHKIFDIKNSTLPTATGGWSTTFGTSTNVDLFVALDQPYVDGAELTLLWKNGTKVENATPVAFKGIYTNK